MTEAFPPTLIPAGVLAGTTLALWATGAVPEALAALLFFGGAIVLRVAPPEVVLSGLTSSAFWMILSGLVLGAAVRATGLGRRIAGALAPWAARGPVAAICAATLAGVALAFAMPSAMGRVVLLVPLLQDLADRLGLGATPARRGILLGGVLGTALPSTAILPSNIPNNVLAGLYERQWHRPMSYVDYLWQHFPVLGALKAALLVLLLAVAFRGREWQRAPARVQAAPWSRAELRLSAYLALAMLGWMTDAVHHVAPAWVGLGAAVLCLAPRVGVLPGDTLKALNAEPLLYVAAVVSLGAVVTHSGLGHWLAGWLGALLAGGGRGGQGGMGSFLALSAGATLLGLFTTAPGLPAVLTPLTDHFASAAGLPRAMVLAAQVAGFSTVLLPYQAPPVAAALQLCGIPRAEMTRILLALAALSALLLWPLDYLWLAAWR